MLQSTLQEKCGDVVGAFATKEREFRSLMAMLDKTTTPASVCDDLMGCVKELGRLGRSLPEDSDRQLRFSDALASCRTRVEQLTSNGALDDAVAAAWRTIET